MALSPLASGWRIARIFGISIRVHLTWLFIFLLLTFSLGGEILPLSNLADGGPWWNGLETAEFMRAYLKANPRATEGEAAARLGIDLWPWWHYWVLAVIGALGLFVCVLAHELAHSLVALGVGIPVEGITLFVFGGVARIRGEAPTPEAEFKVAAAGPLMSLALGLACGVMYFALGWGLPAQARALMHYFMFINLALVAFNLLPGFPLDGGRLLRALLWKVLGSLRRATRIASWCGRGFAGLLIAVGAVEFLWTGASLGALWWVVIGLFLWNAAKASYRQVELREALSALAVRDAVQPQVVAVPPDLPLDRLVDEYFYRYRFRSFPVVEGDLLVGMVGLKDVRTVPRWQWAERRVRDAMQPVDARMTVAPDDDLATVLGRMLESGRRHLAVVADGRLEGIVTQGDLMKVLQIHGDLGARQVPRAG